MECSNGPTDGVRNVTLASAENRTNVTLTAASTRVGGQVLPSAPGRTRVPVPLTTGPNTIARSLLPVRAPTTRRRSALASPAILASIGE